MILDRAEDQGQDDRPDHDSCHPGVRSWSQATISARRRAPTHKARPKRSIQSGVEMDLYDGLALEQELQIQLFRSEDAREGLDSWVDKRVPRFKGK